MIVGIRLSLDAIRRRIQGTGQYRQERSAESAVGQNAALFKVQICVSIPKVVIQPSLEDVQSVLMRSVQMIIRVVEHVPQWTVAVLPLQKIFASLVYMSHLQFCLPLAVLFLNSFSCFFHVLLLVLRLVNDIFDLDLDLLAPILVLVHLVLVLLVVGHALLSFFFLFFNLFFFLCFFLFSSLFLFFLFLFLHYFLFLIFLVLLVLLSFSSHSCSSFCAPSCFSFIFLLVFLLAILRRRCPAQWRLSC